MKIAVNTRMLIRDKMEGIGYFTYETMRRITKSHPAHQFIFLFDRKHSEEFIFSDNITPVEIFPPARHPLLWHLWYEYSLPKFFKNYKVDLFIGTDGYLSLKSKIQTLSVIHDLNFEHFPEDLPYFNRKFYRHYFPLYAKEAKRIVSVSEFTKNDIISKYKIDPGKIDVVYNGVGENFKPINDAEQKLIREKFSHDKPYFLFVGALHQRKNIANLLRAFETFRSSSTQPINLLLTGKRRWWTKEMEEVFLSMKYKNDVVFTGRLSEEDLLKVTASAFAMVYVSTFEGFGIPIIEAMKSAVPVITSNTTSMPEVAGNAALLCDPFSVNSISEKMIQVSKDEILRKNLIQKGLKRAEDFSWDKTADGLWKNIEKCQNVDES